MRIAIPHEHRQPIVLVKSWTGGLAAVAKGVAPYINWVEGRTFFDTDVGSGAIFVQLKAFDKVFLRVVDDPRLRLLYEELRRDYLSVIREAVEFEVSRDAFQAIKELDFSPGRELYLRSLGYRGCWCGNHVRLRQGKPEHLAAWEHTLATMCAVSYKLQNVEFVDGLDVDASITLSHTPKDDFVVAACQSVGKYFLLCKGYAGNGRLLRAFNKGLTLWRL